MTDAPTISLIIAQVFKCIEILGKLAVGLMTMPPKYDGWVREAGALSVQAQELYETIYALREEARNG